MKITAFIIIGKEIIKHRCRIERDIIVCGDDKYVYDTNHIIYYVRGSFFKRIEKIVFLDYFKKSSIPPPYSRNTMTGIKMDIASKLLTYYMAILGFGKREKQLQTILIILIVGSLLLIGYMYHMHITAIQDIVNSLKNVMEAQKPLPPV